MVARAEFHPLAGRVVAWLLALLRPEVCSERASEDDGVLAQRADLLVRQRGAQVSIDCTQRVENRGRAAIQLCWTLPQPPVASAHTVGVHLCNRPVRGQVYRRAEAEGDARRAWDDGRSVVVLWQAGPAATCLAGGWLPPSATMEVRSHHRCTLEPRPEFPEGALHVQMDSALGLVAPASVPAGRLQGAQGWGRAARRAQPSPSHAHRPLRARIAPSGTWARQPPQSGWAAGPAREVRRVLPAIEHTAWSTLKSSEQTPTQLAEATALLTGVLARLGRRAAAGLALRSAGRDRAVFRGVLDGCAARLLLVAPAATEAPLPALAVHEEVEHLLRTYRDRSRAAAERAWLARQITDLALQHGLVTPWTALLAADGVSGHEGEAVHARFASA